MLQLTPGNFFGKTDQKLQEDGLILTNTLYTHDYVDWHHHQNAYFTFILYGRVIEGSKNGRLNLSAGSLLFHNAQESHYNIKPKDQTRGMHIELEQCWVQEFLGSKNPLEGSFEITCAKTKILFYTMLRESSMADGLTMLAMHQLVTEAMDSLFPARSESTLRPLWLYKVKELLHDCHLSPPSLIIMAAEAGVHPVHLSRTFSRYFGCTMAEYIRQIRVTHAMAMLADPKNTYSEIAHSAGFSDQSHMIRCFRQHGGSTPAIFRRLLRL